MITRTKISFATLLLSAVVLLLGCAKSEKEEVHSAAAPADTVSLSNVLSSDAAIEDGDDSLRKFIRTADLRFKVKNVIEATYKIEDITRNLGGFVTYTHLTSRIDQHRSDEISSDSILETTRFTVVNTLTLRVPNIRLDSTLKALAPLVDYLDHRTVQANDIGLQLLSNQWAQQRSRKYEQRLNHAIENKRGALEDITIAEEHLYNKNEASDQAKLSQLSLRDQVRYSTVNIAIYQGQEVRREIIANFRNITIYEAGFGKKIMESLKSGWQILEAMLLFFTQFWALILLGIFAYWVVRKAGYLTKVRLKNKVAGK